MEGWLSKKGSFVKSWKKRWVVLTEDQLEYFVDETKLENKGKPIAIDASTTVLSRDGSNHAFKFGIQTGSRVLEFFTDTEENRLLWMDTLHNIINTHRCNLSGGLPTTTQAPTIMKFINKKKTLMEEDTPMNRALRGQTSTPTGAAPSRTGGKKKMTHRPIRHHSINPSAASAGSSTDEGGSSKVPEEDSPGEHVRESEDGPGGEGSPVPPPGEAKPLPPGWAQEETEDGQVYYYHEVSRVSRWDLPTEDVAEALNQRLQESQKQVEASVERRRAELEQERLREQEEQDEAEGLKAEVEDLINDWLHPPELAKRRGLGELLTCLPDLLGEQIVPEGAISREPLDRASPPAEVKKAYLRAIRLVHPDKIAATGGGSEDDRAMKLIAQEVFIKLSESYKRYRKKHDL